MLEITLFILIAAAVIFAVVALASLFASAFMFVTGTLFWVLNGFEIRPWDDEFKTSGYALGGGLIAGIITFLIILVARAISPSTFLI